MLIATRAAEFTFHKILDAAVARSGELDIRWRRVRRCAILGRANGRDVGAEIDVTSTGCTDLYFTLTDTREAVSGEPGCGGDSAIGVATSTSPAGPMAGQRAAGGRAALAGPGCNFFWTFDPDVIQDGQRPKYIYYGSYSGGIEARPLSADGLTSDPAQAVLDHQSRTATRAPR